MNNMMVKSDESKTFKLPDTPSISFTNSEKTGIMTFTKEGEIIWNDRKLEIDSDVIQMVKDIHEVMCKYK